MCIRDRSSTDPKKVDPDAPGTPGTPGYEPPVKSTDYLTKIPVGPRATKKNIKKNNSVPLSPGYEDPIKIQKVQREGLTPNSQKFSKIAKKNATNKKGQDNPKYRGNYDEVD